VRAIEEVVGIGTAARVLGVSADTLRRWERDGRIRFERSPGGRRTIASSELARVLHERSGGGRTSARNRLEGYVVGVQADGVMAQVDLVCGPYRVVSLMSREAAEELGLRPGTPATAVVKATTVIVERR
jgi:molybdopterin-binding protein